LKNKKYLIIFLLIILVSLSGCIELITTQEKQACLALTHFSSTSIEGCFSQNSCFKQVDSLNIYVSKHVPYEIHNDVLAYKNYVASSYFYYNQTAQKLEKLNSACNEEKTKKIIDSINDLMFYFSQTALYLDYSSKQSINLIKDYTLFLEKEEINLIVEEDLFDDYVLLNQNLNQLKDNKKNDTYLSNLDQRVKELHDFAKTLGIRRTYLSKQNVSDLSLYYLKVYEEEVNAHEIFVPELFGISYFLLGKFSTIMDFRKINLNLSKADGYNFYNVMNRFIGKDNSLLIDFREINNRVNNNLDKVYDRIELLEKSIREKENYLSEEEYFYFEKEEVKFKNNESSFGNYLSTLKEIEGKINKNVIEGNYKDKEKQEELFKCDLIVGQASEFSNFYYKEKIKKYNLSDNYYEKINVCNELNSMLLEDNCFEKVTLFLKGDSLEKKDFELLSYKDTFVCKELLGNINYKLKQNEKIILLNELLENNNRKLKEIELIVTDASLKKEVLDHKEVIADYALQENIVKIIEIDLKIKKLIEIDLKLNNIAKKIIESKKPTIVFIEDEYYLLINNPFHFLIEGLEIVNEYGQLKSKDGLLNITGGKIKINKIYHSDNYFKVEYENKKKITQNIIYLSLNESIVKINVENQVEGIYDTIEFIEGFRSTSAEVRVVGDKVYYTSKKENEIYLVGNLFETEILKTVDEINSEKIILKEDYLIKNKLNQNINQMIYLKEINEGDLIILTENKKEIASIIENLKIKFLLEIKSQETKSFQLQTLTGKNEVFLEVEDLILRAERLNLSRFEDLRSDAQKTLKEILEINYKETYTLNEIKLVFNKINEIERLDLKLKYYESIEKSYLNKYNEILNYELTEGIEKKLNEIDNKKYLNIVFAEKEINDLLAQIKENIVKNNNLEFKNNHDKIIELKEKCFLYHLDLDIDSLITENTIEDIEKIILNKLKEKSNELYKKINPLINNLDVREITEIINKIYGLYEDYNLRDLYSVGYFVAVTENDAKRLEKNILFLDSVLLNREISNFEENLKNQEYEKAIDAISLETINRIEKIKVETETLEKGYLTIKEDAKNEILNYQKEKYDEDILELAKNNYDDEKYLNTIMLIKSNQSSYKSKPKINQLIISVIIVCIFLAIYLYLKLGQKKKEKTTLEKKRKIIRH
jgi:hypothetical protein